MKILFRSRCELIQLGIGLTVGRNGVAPHTSNYCSLVEFMLKTFIQDEFHQKLWLRQKQRFSSSCRESISTSLGFRLFECAVSIVLSSVAQRAPLLHDEVHIARHNANEIGLRNLCEFYARRCLMFDGYNYKENVILTQMPETKGLWLGVMRGRRTVQDTSSKNVCVATRQRIRWWTRFNWKFKWNHSADKHNWMPMNAHRANKRAPHQLLRIC